MICRYDIKPATTKMMEFACKNYHYSKCVPSSRKLGFAIFEEDKFKGVIIYSLGANPHLGDEFGLKQGEIVELTRIALHNHNNPVSFYIVRTLKMIRNISPSVKIVISYADIGRHNHHGGIYQATNWIYLGKSIGSNFEYLINGKWVHPKTINGYSKQKQNYIKTHCEKRKTSDKLKYIYCLDKDLRKKYIEKSKPYVKRLTND